VVALDQFGIHEEDWNNTPGSVSAALMFLLRRAIGAALQLAFSLGEMVMSKLWWRAKIKRKKKRIQSIRQIPTPSSPRRRLGRRRRLPTS
jgi:hypothetical protein